MNEDPSAELSSDEQMAEEEQAVIYAVFNDELLFLYCDEVGGCERLVERISEVRRLLAGGGTYSALIEAIFPLDSSVAYLLERLLEIEEENLEGEDREAGSEKLMFDYAKLDDWLQVQEKMLFEDDNSGLPEEIQERFGQRIVGNSPGWSGEYLRYPAAEEAAIVQALRERGVSATRDDSAVMYSLGG